MNELPDLSANNTGWTDSTAERRRLELAPRGRPGPLERTLILAVPSNPER